MVRIVFAGLALIVVLGSGVSLAQDETRFGYTYHQPSGNRVVEGAGTFPDVTETRLTFASAPIWLVGILQERKASWVVTIEDGRTSHLIPGTIGERLATLLPDLPPMVRSDADGVSLLLPPLRGSQLTHPIPAFAGELYIPIDGDVALLGEVHESRLEVNAMLDARPVVSAEGFIAVYSDPTNERYVHGIMGDDLEAASISILQIVDGELQLAGKIELPGTSVFEGLSPIWADVDGDGEDDLIATVSDIGLGAQVVTMTRDGQPIANGPAIGQGNRWRHQIAWAALGENGEMGLVEVLTPHIGGVVGFFPFPEEGFVMERTASVEGFTSHVIGSRNLDMAVVGDFNGDGQMEVVLPAQNRERIAGLQIRGETFEEVWSLPLDGRLSSNLAAITLPDGTLALAAGTDAGTVYLWLAP